MTRKNQYRPQSIPAPGETLREKLVEMKMGIKEFALETRNTQKAISEVLKGKIAINPEMATQFEYVTKIPATFWNNHQRLYDEFCTRKK